MEINISSHISEFFTYHEALWLPSWGRHANTSDGLNDDVLNRLRYIFSQLDNIRFYFNKPIEVHCAYRPTEYNHFVSGALSSAHIAERLLEAAVDFSIPRLSCDGVRTEIIKQGMLAQFNLRMEDRPGSNWVHIDTRIPPEGSPRFFRP